MDQTYPVERSWAIFFARAILGFIFFMAEFHTHVIPRAALLMFVLVMPRGGDRFSVDHWLARRVRDV